MPRYNRVITGLAPVILFLAACGHLQPLTKIEPREVRIPVPIPCRPELPPEPAYPDTDEALAAAPDIFEGAKLVMAGRKIRIARYDLVVAALKACEGPPPFPTPAKEPPWPPRCPTGNIVASTCAGESSPPLATASAINFANWFGSRGRLGVLAMADSMPDQPSPDKA